MLSWGVYDIADAYIFFFFFWRIQDFRIRVVYMAPKLHDGLCERHWGGLWKVLRQVLWRMAVSLAGLGRARDTYVQLGIHLREGGSNLGVNLKKLLACS
jgi:hypothetical protein